MCALNICIISYNERYTGLNNKSYIKKAASQNSKYIANEIYIIYLVFRIRVAAPLQTIVVIPMQSTPSLASVFMDGRTGNRPTIKRGMC